MPSVNSSNSKYSFHLLQFKQATSILITICIETDNWQKYVLSIFKFCAKFGIEHSGDKTGIKEDTTRFLVLNIISTQVPYRKYVGTERRQNCH